MEIRSEPVVKRSRRFTCAANSQRRVRVGTFGYTMIELLMVASVIGLLFSLGPKFVSDSMTYYGLNLAYAEVRREARLAMSEILRQSRSAKSATVKVDALPGAPPYSRLTFTTIDGVSVSFFQNGRNLICQDASGTRSLGSSLSQLSFALPNSKSATVFIVSIFMQKPVYNKMASELLTDTAHPMN